MKHEMDNPLAIPILVQNLEKHRMFLQVQDLYIATSGQYFQNSLLFYHHAIYIDIDVVLKFRNDSVEGYLRCFLRYTQSDCEGQL